MDKKPPQKRKNLIKTPKKITESYLYNSGLYYLGRYTTSVEHFRFVMVRKIKLSITHHGAPTMDQALILLQNVIDRFIVDSLLNDSAYAKGLINSLRRRGLSRNAILQKTMQKKLNAELASDTLQRLDTETMDISCKQQEIILNNGLEDNIEYRSALIHARKKRLGPYSKINIIDDEKIYKRQLSSFARAGYGFEIARNILAIPPFSEGY